MQLQYRVVQEAAYRADLDPAQNCGIQEYSGRAMYGRECFGLVVSDIGQLIAFMQEYRQAHELLADEAADGDYDIDDQLHALRRASQDSMGYDTIIYWPEITLDQYGEEEDAECA